MSSGDDVQYHGAESSNPDLLKKYSYVLRNIYDELFEVNVTNNFYRIIFHTENKYLIPPREGRIDEMLTDIAENMIYPSDKTSFQSFFDIEKIMNAFASGTKSLVTDFRKKCTNGEYRWAQATLLPVADDESIIWLCYILDIDQKKSLEEQNRFISTQFIESFGSIYMDILELDLDTGLAIIMKASRFPVNDSKLLDYDTLLINFANQLVYEKDKDSLIHEMTTTSLKYFMNNGRNQKSSEVRCLVGGSAFEWLEISAYLIPTAKIGTNKVLLTTKNINEHKIMTSIIDKFVYSSCDYFILIDAVHDSYKMISGRPGIVLPPSVSNNYSKEMETYNKAYVIPEEAEMSIQAMSLSTVAEELDKNSEHICYVSMSEKSEIKRKKIQYVYYDKPNKLILLIRTDVTHIYNEEKRKNDLLYGALREAETANKAKTDFLSRMSHDIRTPMNAIMGMTAIAQERIEDSTKVTDCLNKINASSQFLLSLINDVLDMSRIESGMMSIHENKFDFEEFLKNIFSIVNPQSTNRGLKFVIKPEPPLAQYYIGDMLRINQILVNLLSNSVKYNKPGGRLELNVREIERVGTTATIEFRISDNGYGMSKEFMHKMYEPFEQENSDIARNQIGSGLGLSIVSSLVKLMGGTISAESEQNVGTVFRITIDMGVVSESTNIEEQNDLNIAQDDIRVLIVDDDVVTCEHATIILKGMDILSESVNSGQEAIKRIQDAMKHNIKFDAILTDWRMPVMDGMQTATELRKILEYNSVIIIMTSYSTSELEQAENFSLIDMIITKPLSRKALSHVFSQVKKYPTGHPRTVSPINRLNGKNVLVVEDNLINMEIIKTMLEFKNMTVETAENGHIAVEKFKNAPEGHYDAIFMDIRMPVMGGIEATQTIRNLGCKKSETIPIIAISADAFQKDVKAALESGMDHYLVKPLEVNKLNHILETIF